MPTPTNIRELIANGNTKQAIQETKKIIPPKRKDLKTTLFTIEASYKQLESDRQSGIISTDEYARRKAMINNSLLLLLDQMEEKSQLSPRPKSKKLSLIIITGLLAIIFAAYFIWSNNSESVEIPLTSEQISALAGEYGLNDIQGINNHLTFKSGDIAYWDSIKLPKDEITIHFKSRKQVLEKASKENRKIVNQGDLAYEAEILAIKNLTEKYGLTTKQEFNSNLAYDNGDFQFWRDKGLTFKEIEEQFKILQSIIKNAEKNKIKIMTKGDLGYLLDQELKKRQKVE